MVVQMGVLGHRWGCWLRIPAALDVQHAVLLSPRLLDTKGGGEERCSNLNGPPGQLILTGDVAITSQDGDWWCIITPLITILFRVIGSPETRMTRNRRKPQV